MNIFNIKSLVAVCALALTFNASAFEVGGKVGVASDNIFRGVNMSDGFGYSAKGYLKHDSGLWAGGSFMSMDSDADAYMYGFKGGYGFDVAGVKVNVGYADWRVESDLGNADWQEVGLGLDFDLFAVKYVKGLDEASDYYEINSGFLKVVDVAYGDWKDAGSFWKVSKGFDLLGGEVEVGFIDHELNAEDFADKIQDVDNFYIGYSYKF